ncbi:hypothetical protein [Microbulbifer sp. THAF38]|uniref:hypothetical protein n=1 Tax=Microbulbifer sp. THAF38 TaxID=2587856 RepID=UPI001562B7D9|nr:hypothetical protein [Microbulbifer sp. THAF38]
MIFIDLIIIGGALLGGVFIVFYFLLWIGSSVYRGWSMLFVFAIVFGLKVSLDG